MKVAIYIRVSTEEQYNEGYSIAAQRDRLVSFCHSQEWDVVEMYVEEGKSAKDLERPELKRLLSDAESGLFEIVLVYRLDRLTRSVLDLYKLLQTFEKNNVKFKSATEMYDTTTAMGKLFITLVAALAQWERENLAERVRFGMEQMVLEGKRPGGPIPFGYNKDGTIIEDEAKVLRELRRIYMDGNGYRTVAKTLNQMNMLKRGMEWSSTQVFYVLDNPYYAGKLRYGSKKSNGGYASRKKEERVDVIYQDSDHEKIFTWEEYEEHRKRMKLRQFNGYTKKNEYWFTGVLRCSRCGSSMTGRYTANKRKDGSIRQIIFYICAKSQSGERCNMPMFRQIHIEKLIMEYITKIKLDHKKLKELSKHEASKKADIEKEIKNLNKELEKIADRKKKWQYAFVEDLISADELRQRNEEEAEKEKYFQSKLLELTPKASPKKETSELLMTLPDIWGMLDDKDKHELILTIFNKIELFTPHEKVVARKGKFFDAYIKSVEYN